MPFDAKPTVLLGSNYLADATNVTIKIADIPQLIAAEADELTGDSRKLLYAILDKVQTAYAALPDVDKPTKVRIQRSSTAPNAAGTFQTTFTLSFTLAIAGAGVAAE